MALRKKLFIKNLQPGDIIDELFLVREAGLREARNGSFYIQATLADASGDIPARQWDVRQEDANLYPAGGFVRVQGRVETYRNRPQLIVQRLKIVEPDSVVAGDFFAASEFDIDALQTELLDILGQVEDRFLHALLETIFTDRSFMERFRRHPAAASFHHAFVGGLLEHTTMLARSAVNLCRGNHRLDRDLMITGALLHDIGKLDEITDEKERSYSDVGRLIGHLVIGVLRVDEAMRSIPDFPEQLRMLVHHLILSHHGTREFGSPVLPATPEAVALHHLDNIDAKTEAASRAIATDPNTERDFTDRLFMFGNVSIYKRGRPDADKPPNADKKDTADPKENQEKGKRKETGGGQSQLFE